MLRRAQTLAEKMIKVDHAGENGAVNIYRAQKLVAYLRAKFLLPHLKKNQAHEEQHRHIFANYLAEKRIKRCASYHACGLGGFTLGLITGLMGPGAVAATTYAVEHVVLNHLEEQINHLKEFDVAALSCVARIVEDERLHHDAAERQLQKDKILTGLLIRIVGFSTEQVIRFGMR
jgi:3-demethoxyubiquinol 3-hydroxylase